MDLTIFGQTFTNVAGIKATNTGGTTEVFEQGGGDQPTLSTPFVGLCENRVTIYNPIENGNYVTSYDIYIDGVQTYNTQSLTYDIPSLNVGQVVKVKAKGENFQDSSFSNEITKTKYFVVQGTDLSVSIKRFIWNTGTLEYSTNKGSSWSTITQEIKITNNEIWFRGSGLTNICDSTSTVFPTIAFDGTNIIASGNIESLLDYSTVQNNGHPTIGSYCFTNLFNGCHNLIIAPALFATTLASYCYSNMFMDCISLVTAPTISATTLAQNCCQYMFQGCQSLTTAPTLLATTLTGNCYANMFYNCVSLTTAPSLPATSLANYCYYQMFYGCSSLTTAPSLPATSLASDCYANMFYGCSSLLTAPIISATTLAGYCCQRMFYNCKSLTTPPPRLSATTLATYCYADMFYGCSSLLTAPIISATTLAGYCCQSMFYNCVSLTTPPALSAKSLADRCYNQMFYNCVSLTTAPSLPATSLANYCYYQMFYGCSSLTTIPNLPATTLTGNCYLAMFAHCTKLKLSASQGGEYVNAYRIPKSGTGSAQSTSLTNMFLYTGGTFTGTPKINTTYYTSNIIV